MSDYIPRRASDIPRLRARPAFAMMLALGAIVVIGLLIGGVFFITNQQIRGGRDAMTQERAFRIAEGGLVQRVRSWKGSINPSQPGRSTVDSLVVSNVPGDPKARVIVTMLTDSLFQVMSEATVGSGARSEGTRRLTQLVRLRGPLFNIRGALTVRGSTKIGGASLIDGNDTPPTGWPCGSSKAAKPGIAIADTSKISTSGCGGYSCISGNPKVSQDPIAGNTDTYFKYGDLEWASLVSMADLVVTTTVFPAPAYTADMRCRTPLMSNWGDINRAIPVPGACEGYFPIIYFPGNAKLTGGTGQGILLVEGDLEVQGAFQFFGPVIVRGSLKTAGTGGHFNGAVMAANVDLEENTVLGNAVVKYSSCAVETAVRNMAPAMPLPERSWAEM